MPRDPLTEDELIAQLMGDPPAEPDAGDSAMTTDAIEEVIAFAGAIAQAEKGGRLVFQRAYLAGQGKVAFVFDTSAVVLEIPEDVLPELQPAAMALLHYLEGDHA